MHVIRPNHCKACRNSHIIVHSIPFTIHPFPFSDRYFYCVLLMYICFFDCKFVNLTAYPAVYGQFPQAIPQPIAAVAPAQREGKHRLPSPQKLARTVCSEPHPTKQKQTP